MATKRVRKENGMEQDQESEAGFEDQTSELPAAIILHMLSFLPTLNAVRTSLLSKRWRRMWTLVPVLDFHDLRDSSHFRRHDWCQFLENKNVKESDLCVYPKISYWPLPRFMPHLRELALPKLSGLALLVTLVLSSLPSLKELYFSNIKMDDQVLTNLLLCCPSLEKLNMNDCHGLSNPEV